MTVSEQFSGWDSLVSEKSLHTLHRFGGVFQTLAVRLALGKLDPVTSDLRHGTPRLAQASSYLEKQFLAIQKTLEQLAASSQDLIFHGQKVVTMASGQEMGDVSFEDVFTLLDRPLEYLSETQISMEELAVGLRSSVDAIRRLLDSERALEATVAPLQITQVMFRIQSAYLPSEHRQIFNSVTDEIVTLQAQIQSAFTEHVRVLTGLHNNLLQVVEGLEHQLATQGRKIGQKRAELSSYLTALTAEIENNAGRRVELTAASEELGAKVRQAIVSLQTQDIVAQKLEHARGGIEEVLQALRHCQSTGQTDCFARVAAITRVEVAQLDRVIAEVENSDRSLRSGFDGITGLLDKLNGDTLLLKEFREMTVSASGGIQGLLNSLGEIREMVAATLAITRMAEESVLPVRNATEGLTSTVQGVAHEMHLIALNAQIQAIQMGEGTGLDVLAAHSTEVSQSTTRISMEVAAKVAEVAAAVAAHSDRLSALRQDGERQQAELEEKGGRQEAALHHFRDLTLDEFRATGEALETARRFGAGIATLLNLEPAVAEIRGVRANVAELHRQGEALEKALGADERQVNLSDLERKYTMASERRVHAEVFGRAPASAPVQAPSNMAAEAALPATEFCGEDQRASEEQRPGEGHEQAEEPVAIAAGEFGEGVELF